MPNFSYTASKAWTPYTFEEILKPLAMYTEEYNKLEEALSALDAEAATAGAMASEANDPITYGRYKSYEEAIKLLADLIAKYGLSPSSRKAILDLKTKYVSDILPINKAIERRRILADEIRKAKLANPTLMVLRDFNIVSPESSLDRFIENPEYNYGDIYSGALLTKQVSDMASHLAKELRGTSTGKLDEYTNTFLKKYGLSSNEVLLAITNPEDPRASKALLAIYNSALESVPLSLREQYADDINSYINQGFWSAVGLNLIGTYENYEARLNAQELSDIKREIIKAGLKGNLPTEKLLLPRIIEGVEGEIDPKIKRMEGLRPVKGGMSTTALDKAKEKYNKAVEKYLNYIKNRDSKKDEEYEAYLESLKRNKDAATALRYSNVKNAPSGYSTRASLKKLMLEAKRAYEEELAFLDLMELEYSHLGRTRLERLQIGYALNNILLKKELSSYPLNFKESQYNDIRNGLLNVFNAAPEDLFDSGFGLTDKKGNRLDREEVIKIFADENDKPSLKVKSGSNAGLKLVKSGKEYDIKGIEAIDRYNNHLRTINNYLSDFSSNITLETNIITPDVLREINSKGISNTRFPISRDKLVRVGNGYGTTLYEPTSGEYIKLLLDDLLNLVAASSLSDALLGGTQTDKYFTDIASTGLNSLTNLFARKNE